LPTQIRTSSLIQQTDINLANSTQIFLKQFKRW
jgi:hypothetical protein